MSGRAGHVEVETTWTPATPDAPLPDLAGADGVASVEAPVVHRLEAVYLDTSDLTLVRAGVTLRRRLGGDDEGWHLKLPAARGREEVHAPLGRSARPPVRLVRLVLASTGGAPLLPVARISTERTVRRLRDDVGAVVAEVADDQVVGVALDPADPARGTEVRWREWEVELVGPGDDRLLAAVAAVLAGVDARPAAVGRKIEMVLGDRLDDPEGSPPDGSDEPEEPEEPLHLYLAAQVDEIVRCDPGARRGHADEVHRTRIACRRLRSVLATLRPFLDRDVTDPLRDELRWYASVLGAVRDPQVAAGRVRTLVDDLPAHLVVGPVRRRVTRAYRDRERAATRAAGAAMTSDRYLDLLAVLRGLAAAPPWLDGTPGPGRLRRRVRRDWHRVRDGVTAARDGDGDWHDVRKAAKRLRYACELVEPLESGRARRLRKAAKRLSSALGEGQDTAVTRADLLDLARLAHAAGESTFTYGLLHAREAEHARSAQDDADAAWDRLRRRKVRAWLSG